MTSAPDNPEPRNDGGEHLFGRPLSACPACNSGDLVPVVENQSQEVHFFCRACGRCWRVELGFVHRVIPPTCQGCPERERCEAVYAADHLPAPR